MPIRGARDISVIPNGLADSLDGNTARPGGLASLQNLIPSPATPGLFVCRPAAFVLSLFAGFTTPGYVSAYIVQGTRIYGMIASARNAGQDEPFCYDTATGAFVTISGVTSGNTPTSPATTGAWTPPTMAAAGSKIVVTHPGFNGSGSNFFGVIDLSTFASPAWSASNTGTNTLPSVPTFVCDFNDRFYFACGNTAFFSDVLSLTMSNATNFFVFGGKDAITAMHTQPFFTTQQGGIAGALLVMKQLGIWQITGDLATTNLAQNEIVDNVGTLSPRSLAVTPLGVMFLAADGVRAISLQGEVSQPNQDVVNPFLNVVTPSRVSAQFTQGTYRICLTSQKAGVAQIRDYWFDVNRQLWTGPHTISYDAIEAIGGAFIISGPTFSGLMQSNAIPGALDQFLENGADMTFNYQTATVPEGADIMRQKTVVEQSLFMTFNAQVTLNFNLLDPSGNALASTGLTTPFLAPTGGTNRPVSWAQPVDFTRAAVQVTGTCVAGLGLGTTFIRYTMTDALGAAAFDQTVAAKLDFGSVTDPTLTVAMDWGTVVDSVVASRDFGVLS